MAKFDNKDVLEGIDMFSCIVSWKKNCATEPPICCSVAGTAGGRVATNTKTTKEAVDPNTFEPFSLIITDCTWPKR